MDDPGTEPLHARDKLVRATAELLSERTAPVTTREIAERAGLQPSLIHRYFGGKEGLVQAVLAQVSAQYVAVVDRATTPAEGFADAFGYLADHWEAVLAFAFAAPGDPDHAFPGVAAHVEQLRAAATPGGRDPRVLALAGLALMAGWSGVEPVARRAAGLEDVPVEEVRRQIGEILVAMIEREQAGG